MPETAVRHADRRVGPSAVRPWVPPVSPISRRGSSRRAILLGVGHDAATRNVLRAARATHGDRFSDAAGARPGKALAAQAVSAMTPRGRCVQLAARAARRRGAAPRAAAASYGMCPAPLAAVLAAAAAVLCAWPQPSSNSGFEPCPMTAKPLSSRPPPTPPRDRRLLARLATDHDLVVRVRVAKNPAVSVAILQALCRDPVSAVRVAASANPALSTSAVRALAASGDTGCLAGAASNPNAPPTLLAQWAAHPDSVVRVAVAGNAASGPDTLRDLAGRRTLRRLLGCYDQPELSRGDIAAVRFRPRRYQSAGCVAEPELSR